MGIDDREYYRDERRPRRLGAVGAVSVNAWIIGINCAVFLLMAFSPTLNAHLFNYGHFSTFEGFGRLEVWRLVTFQFLHANLLHLFFNMFGLYLFGGMVEQFLGGKRYLAFYLVCGIFGGLTYLLLNLLGWGLQTQFLGLLVHDPRMPLVGASAGVFGVILACAYIEPKATVQLLFPPIPITLRTLAYGYVGIAAFNLITGGRNAGGDAAHLGGAAAGFFFIRNAHLLRDFFDVFGRNPSRRDAAHSAGVPRDRVDVLLDKIRREGLASLDAQEREALRRATEEEAARRSA